MSRRLNPNSEDQVVKGQAEGRNAMDSLCMGLLFHPLG